MIWGWVRVRHAAVTYRRDRSGRGVGNSPVVDIVSKLRSDSSVWRTTASTPWLAKQPLMKEKIGGSRDGAWLSSAKHNHREWYEKQTGWSFKK